MLQVTKTVVLLLLIAAASSAAADSARREQSVEWLLEDALEAERIRLELPEVSTPAEVAQALAEYRRGEYRNAVIKLEKLRGLALPDGRSDFVYFILGECYRALGLSGLARARYSHVLSRFPASDKAAPALYRLLEYAYHERNSVSADSILEVFGAQYQNHPLYHSVVYAVGLLYYRTERYGEAIELLLKIPKISTRHYQAQFLVALCFVRVGKTDKALFHLGYVRKNSLEGDLVAESNIVIGDIYYTQGNLETALKYYAGVPNDAPRRFYALVKTARVYTELKEYARARNIAEGFLAKNRKSPHYFEMASVLEQVYANEGDSVKAARINYLVYKQTIDAKLAFEIDRELGFVHDMMARWKHFRLDALARGDEKLQRDAERNLDRLERLAKENRKVLYEIGVLSRLKADAEVPGLAERRYVNGLRREVSALEDSVAALEAARARTAPEDPGPDSAGAGRRPLDSLRARLADVKNEFESLKSVAWVEEGGRFSDEMQAKFIDWAFMQYLDKKEQLAKLAKEMSGTQKDEQKDDSLSRRGATVVSLFTSIDREKLQDDIVGERRRLIDHIETFLELNPNNRYFPQILFRLAELYYDEAVEDFDRRLRVYEESMAREDADSADLAFPEYDLSRTMRIYDRIIGEHPRDWLADDAHFYKAMALQKLGRFDEANTLLLALIENYPESEYFVEANMNVGRYYFENPKVEDGKGYDLAQKAYRRVLHYRDHPQFVEALYHLGWCYYMQDAYRDAIAVFKYLIEEVDLDFDPRRMEEKQLTNPLLRAEAIDYIAISFDEEENMDGAVRFLELIDNPDYAALVLQRIGLLREEDMDYRTAVTVYQRLLSEYPNSMVAPDATISLIKVYETMNRTASAMQERQRFFTRYARGSAWQQVIAKKDSALIGAIDSMAISMGLFVADAQYRQAETGADLDLFRDAVASYERLVSAYPEDPRAAEGRWNLAVILENKLQKKKPAYGHYAAYSGLEGADRSRREQAALNAIAIAQSLLPADTTLEAGKLSIAAVKVIEASQNYIELFPDGKAFGDVVLSMGSVFFNRKMYSNAADAFAKITEKGPGAPRFYDAQLLVAKCYFGEEKWIPAAEAFEQVWKGSGDEEQKEEARKLMLQARYLFAKQLLDSKSYENAALAYLKIEEDYPGSDYGDVVLFSAAEAYEKMEAWLKACDAYRLLYTRYPKSKLAPDALFNAATAYEKAEKYDKAAETYEMLVARYTKSDKAKDGLFNLGFCYEKMGELEKMAEANERYTELYPEEKDVEAMLMRSA
ncbi:MAG: tetratricopeptide repeat protein, partial [Chitinivibrionales bacterium]|nr:tetratricopeptide repeat protein [Chitinivibrionales bacterium]MBD3397168.1 tetratricopeptide repeat protein [Chitinivibrionales bacterium]